ncbi:MAG: SDR family oxidoreductase [Chloroflexi bacterium]|nr:SDR family oxidoreductase [Chloroflexota bacterium]
MKVVVTGGAGFIGSHLVDGLLDKGAEVTVLDNLSTGSLGNLDQVIGDIRFVEDDIRDLDAVKRAVAGADTVFHEAALGSVPRSIEDPATSNDVNVNGTLNVLVASRDAGVRRVVFASSSSVYGDTPTLPKHEEMPTVPTSPYGVTKLAAEMYFRAFACVYGLETVCLRYFNVFGPRQEPNSMYAAVIPKFVKKLLASESPTVFGDGDQSRDFTFVSNVVDANLLAMDSTAGIGEVFNIAAGDPVTLNALAEQMQLIMETDIPLVYEGSRPGDIRHSFGDITRARAGLGYEPRVRLEEGLRQTVPWFSGVKSHATI